MLIANYRGLRQEDPEALLLAQRWSKVVAVKFVVEAVTGTVLSFEFGLESSQPSPPPGAD